MYVVLALAPELVRVHFVEERSPCAVQDVLAAHFEAGGAGVTAARILAGHGMPVTLVSLAGGPLAEIFGASLAEEGIAARLVPVPMPMPLRLRQHVTTMHGGMKTREFREQPLRLGDDDLRRLLQVFEELLPCCDGVILCGDNPSPGAAFVLREAAQRVQVREVPCLLCAGTCEIPDAIAAGYSIVDARALEPDSIVDLGRRFLGAGGRALVLAEAAAVTVCTASGQRSIEWPQASERDSGSAGEALAAGLLHKLAAGWELVPAISYGMAAATAQQQKKLGGRLRRSEVEGFFAQVRPQA